MRMLQLEVNLFNRGFASFVFMTKYCALGIIVACGLAANQLFSRMNSLFGVMNAVAILDSMILFNTLYDNGFSVPRRLQRLKNVGLLRLKSMPNVTKEEHDRLKRLLGSIRNTAVKVGNFHRLQRTSTPMFIDFAMKTTVRLVMFFRRM